jgi:hypothetical protein
MRVTIPIAELDPTPWPSFRHARDGETTMSTANFAGRGGVMTRIAPHATGHEWARDDTLLRVDCERGIGWVATHYDLSLRVIQQVRGSDEEVHRVAACWAQDFGKP